MKLVKTLRSFIHEKIPLQLRVDLDLLSRRRDLRGEQKAEEVIQLFRKYDIGNISQLGPGTNRYGLKLDGFVIKVATDKDGKIDNFKEFKMAKILFPKVPKTYEVSKNGSLLIAEYVQPFDSYQEMLKYADRIRNILTELSNAGFLIGDAGITGKNRANWGIRVGTDEVVCLDFAYIYDVSSDLFICRHCHANAMVIPNKDFTKLVCTNPACQKETSFEDIRTMISNEYHEHQIGDLTEEGYLMTDSNVVTELVDSKSNYLIRRRGKKVDKPQSTDTSTDSHEESIIDSISNHSIEEEDMIMFKNEVTVEAMPSTPNHPFAGLTVTGITIGEAVTNGAAPVEIPAINDDSAVAFSGTITPDAIDDIQDIIGETVIDDPEYGDEDEEEAVEETTDDQVEEFFSDAATSGVLGRREQFLHKFCNESHRAISKISNKIVEELHVRETFESLKAYLNNKKMYPAEFYTSAGNAIFKSMVSFLQFVECEVPNSNNNGTHKEFKADYDLVNSDTYPAEARYMLMEIERCYNTRAINSKESFTEMVDAYNAIYGVNGEPTFMFPNAWVDDCTSRLAMKSPMQLTAEGLFKLSLLSLWHPDEDDEGDDDDVTEADETAEDDEDEEISVESMLRVDIYPDDDFDVMRIKTEDAFGGISIPIYGNLDAVSTAPSDKTVDLRNGVWDWMAHMVPDFMFKTKDPDKYIIYNNVNRQEVQGRVVILGEDEDGYTVVAITYMAGIYVIDDDLNSIPMFQEEVLQKLNRLFVDTIAGTGLSHLKRSLGMKELIHDEEYASQFFIKPDEYVDAEDSIDEEEEPTVDSEDDDPEYGDEGDDEDPEEELITDEPAGENMNVEVAPDEAVSTVSEDLEAAAIAAMIDDNSINSEVVEPAAGSKPPKKRDEKGRFVAADNAGDGEIAPVRRRKKS